MRYSYSRISTFEECEFRYFQRYIQGIKTQETLPLTVGSFTHAGLAAFNKGGLECGFQEIKNCYEEAIVGKDESRYKKAAQKARDALRVYSETCNFDVVAVELDVSRSQDDVEFHGVIDALVVHERELYTLEYKTGKPDKEYLMLYNWQAPFYSWLSGAAGTLFVLINTSVKNIRVQVKPIEWSETELDKVVDVAVSRVHQMENTEVFLPRRTYQCKWCSYNVCCVNP